VSPLYEKITYQLFQTIINELFGSRFYPALFYPDFMRISSRGVADDILKRI